MEKCFCAGVALGMIGGALLVANSKKARRAVEKGQTEILQKLEQLRKETEEQPSSAPTKKSEK